MKLTFTILLLLIIGCAADAQTVTDTHPNASIYIIDYNSGDETPATSDVAILFKNALVDLVSKTNTARLQTPNLVPGHKSFVITQVDPKTGYGFQITLQSLFLKQTLTIYTFLYNIDQNTLYYFDKNSQDWIPELVQGNNVLNQNNCLALSKFNDPNNGQYAQDAGGQAVQDGSADNTPVDTSVTATTVPPPLPDYEQPECPQDGYLWQPGYWAYSPNADGYYWVPGAWVAPPDPGYLWTPPYWGYSGGFYVFHQGYWGNSIGFYGGINYGYGYDGRGYVGGEWREGRFRYNTAVVRVNVNVVHNTYVNTTVINNTVVNNHVSFNGHGGIMVRPTPNEVQAMRQPHITATPEQIRNQRIARSDKSQFASANGGRPASLAAPKVPATNPNSNQNQRRPATGGSFGSRINNPASPNSGTNVQNLPNVRTNPQGSTNTVRANTQNPGGGRPAVPASTVPKPVMPGSAGGRTGGIPNNGYKPRPQPVKQEKPSKSSGKDHN